MHDQKIPDWPMESGAAGLLTGPPNLCCMAYLDPEALILGRDKDVRNEPSPEANWTRALSQEPLEQDLISSPQH